MAPSPTLAQFDVLERLAVGGMAEIYRARARGGPLAGFEVVLKRLLPTYRTQPRFVEQFIAEARLGTTLNHPRLVATRDLMREGEDYFIVQDLVAGPTLGAVWKQARASGARLPLEAALAASSDLLEGLEYLHRGGGVEGRASIVHRDVNPENLVIGPQGRMRLIDLGISEVMGEPARTRTGALRGTPAYMSPEQVRGEQLDPRSDLFSAGVVLWELLCGQPLFSDEGEYESLRLVCETNAPPLRTRAPEAGTGLERVLVRALARQRARRFPSAGELRDALLAAGRRVGAAPSFRALAEIAGDRSV